MASKGILGRKLGMTQVWDAENRVVPVTVIQAGPCRVVQLKTPERDGYAAVQLSFGATKRRAAHQARARAPQAGRRPSRPGTSRSSGSTTSRATRSARSSRPTCSAPASASTSPASARARASPA